MGDRVNVSHRSCPNGTWEVVSWRSGRSSRTPGVRKYRGFRLALARPRRHLMVADRVTMVVGMDGLVRISKPTAGKENTQPNGSVLVAGPHSHVVVAEYDRQLFGVSVVLEPWAAFALFGVPMYQLANSVLTIREVLGLEAGDLARQLGTARVGRNDSACWKACSRNGSRPAGPILRWSRERGRSCHGRAARFQSRNWRAWSA